MLRSGFSNFRPQTFNLNNQIKANQQEETKKAETLKEVLENTVEVSSENKSEPPVENYDMNAEQAYQLQIQQNITTIMGFDRVVNMPQEGVMVEMCGGLPPYNPKGTGDIQNSEPQLETQFFKPKLDTQNSEPKLDTQFSEPTLADRVPLPEISMEEKLDTVFDSNKSTEMENSNPQLDTQISEPTLADRVPVSEISMEEKLATVIDSNKATEMENSNPLSDTNLSEVSDINDIANARLESAPEETNLNTRDKSELAKETTLSTLNNTVDNGYKILYGESITESGLSNEEVKEKLILKFPESNIAKLSYIRNEEVNLLTKSESGCITRKVVYDSAKNNLLTTFPDSDMMSETLKKDYDTKLSTLSQDEIRNFQTKVLELPNTYSAEYETSVEQFNTDFTKATNGKSQYSLNNENETIGFKETFEQTYGVEYSEEKLENLSIAQNNFVIATQNETTRLAIHENLDNATTDSDINKGLIKTATLVSSSKDDGVLTATLQTLSNMESVSVSAGEVSGDLTTIKSNVLENVDTSSMTLYNSMLDTTSQNTEIPSVNVKMGLNIDTSMMLKSSTPSINTYSTTSSSGTDTSTTLNSRSVSNDTSSTTPEVFSRSVSSAPNTTNSWSTTTTNSSEAPVATPSPISYTTSSTPAGSASNSSEGWSVVNDNPNETPVTTKWSVEQPTFSYTGGWTSNTVEESYTAVVNKTNDAYKNAFGETTQKQAQAAAESEMTWVDYVALGIETVGAGMTIIGPWVPVYGPAITLAGVGLSTYGGVGFKAGVELVDGLIDGDIDEDKMKSYGEEALKNTALAGLGFGIAKGAGTIGKGVTIGAKALLGSGKTAGAVANTAGTVADNVTDFGLSMLGDALITGETDATGTLTAQVVGNVIPGIKNSVDKGVSKLWGGIGDASSFGKTPKKFTTTTESDVSINTNKNPNLKSSETGVSTSGNGIGNISSFGATNQKITKNGSETTISGTSPKVGHIETTTTYLNDLKADADVSILPYNTIKEMGEMYNKKALDEATSAINELTTRMLNGETLTRELYEEVTGMKFDKAGGINSDIDAVLEKTGLTELRSLCEYYSSDLETGSSENYYKKLDKFMAKVNDNISSNKNVNQMLNSIDTYTGLNDLTYTQITRDLNDSYYEDAVFKGFEKLSQKLIDGETPSLELLMSVSKDVAGHYDLNRTQLEDYMLKYIKTDENWSSMANSFKHRSDRMSDSELVNSSVNAKEFLENTGVKKYENKAVPETGIESILTENELKNIYDPKVEDALFNLYDRMSHGELPSKETFEEVLNDIAFKYSLDKSDFDVMNRLAEDIRYEMGQMENWKDIKTWTYKNETFIKGNDIYEKVEDARIQFCKDVKNKVKTTIENENEYGNRVFNTIGIQTNGLTPEQVETFGKIARNPVVKNVLNNLNKAMNGESTNTYNVNASFEVGGYSILGINETEAGTTSYMVADNNGSVSYVSAEVYDSLIKGKSPDNIAMAKIINDYAESDINNLTEELIGHNWTDSQKEKITNFLEQTFGADNNFNVSYNFDGSINYSVINDKGEIVFQENDANPNKGLEENKTDLSDVAKEMSGVDTLPENPVADYVDNEAENLAESLVNSFGQDMNYDTSVGAGGSKDVTVTDENGDVVAELENVDALTDAITDTFGEDNDFDIGFNKDGSVDISVTDKDGNVIYQEEGVDINKGLELNTTDLSDLVPVDIDISSLNREITEQQIRNNYGNKDGTIDTDAMIDDFVDAGGVVETYTGEAAQNALKDIMDGTYDSNKDYSSGTKKPSGAGGGAKKTAITVDADGNEITMGSSKNGLNETWKNIDLYTFTGGYQQNEPS